MDSESRARSSHYLLLLGACKLPENGLGYRGRGLNRQGVHEHVRRRSHIGPDLQPAGCQFDATPAKLDATLYENVSPLSSGLEGKSCKKVFARTLDPSLLARISDLIGLTYDDIKVSKVSIVPSQQI